jgi:hypothetical protein
MKRQETSMRHALMLCAMAALAAGCAPDVPDEPTWTEDVRPIVIGNCTRCHSPPPIGGAPAIVRFDKYDDEDRDDDGTPDVFGARSSAMTMATRVEGEEMPPDFPLNSRQIDVIVAWADSGAQEGPPVEGNQAPTMELLGEFEPDGDFMVAPYRIDDPDFDLVTGRVDADPDGDGPVVPVTFDLFSGQSQIVWDISEVPAGSYELAAEIEDGSATETIDLGSVNVGP